jgi:hypothetical protein
MATKKTVSPDDLPKITKKIRAKHESVKRHSTLSVYDAADAGELLAQVQPLKKEEKDWVRYLREDVEMPRRTATDYIKLDKTRRKWATVAHLGVRGVLEFLRTGKTGEEDEEEKARDLTVSPPTPGNYEVHHCACEDFAWPTNVDVSGSMKPPQVLYACGLSGLKLADLVDGDDIDEDKVAALLQAMKEMARPVMPSALGAIGRANWERGTRDLYRVAEDLPVRYKLIRGEADARPFVVEAALGYLPEGSKYRVLRTGINWSPCLQPPLDEVEEYLADALVDACTDVFVGLHIITPLVGFDDRGKSRISLPRPIKDAIQQAIASVTRKVTSLLRRQQRQEKQLRRKDLETLKTTQKPITLKQAVWDALPEAYDQVTGGLPGSPAQARQIMYAVRRRVLDIPGVKWCKRDATITQFYLPQFIEAHPDITATWNVVYDARGHLEEPHSGRRIPLGTLQVRQYLSDWKPFEPPNLSPAGGEAAPAGFVRVHNNAVGPENRYRFALIVEKEGFDELLRHTRIAERFDIALVPTKGLSTTACRDLVEELSAMGVTTLVLHDFDLAGLKILHTLRNDTRRYKFKAEPKVVDLGLRLEDARGMGLDGEVCEYRMHKDPREYLTSIGTTPEERAFLVERKAGSKLWVGRRVELNEMTNAQFITYLEGKLTEAGVRKVVPDKQTLGKAYVAAVRQAHIDQAVEEARARAATEFANLKVDVPEELRKLVVKQVKGTEKPWNDGLAEVIRKNLESK